MKMCKREFSNILNLFVGFVTIERARLSNLFFPCKKQCKKPSPSTANLTLKFETPLKY
jgi:hypothetical protein